uniref:Tetratricopeptide repeat-containing protein n=1 Tax=Candidatus Kentrum sp. DK TaxID=2126562 RepID=A0A450SCV0_9GAMM|nr:MAG: Tetratricopeptide repeat-containing protein [Candidatus Kentron sp. DK]
MKTNRYFFVLLLLLALPVTAASPVGEGGGIDDLLIEGVIQALREENGKEPGDEEIADGLNRATVKLLNDGKYTEAEFFARPALAFGQQRLGAEHPNTLDSRNNLADLYRVQGHYREAEPLYRRTLETQEKLLGPEHPQTLISRNNLAALYYAQGRYGEALSLFQRALLAQEKVLGPEHPDTLISLNNLSLLYKAQGRYREAEPIYQRVLASAEKVLGTEHPQTLASLNNLAALYEALGHYGKAEPLYKRALAAFEKVLGPEHPDTLTSRNNLAALYEAQGRYGEAESLHKRALATREKVLGPEHPDTLTSRNNLAGLYDSQGRYGEAESLYRRALAAREKVLGPEHPQTLQSLNNLAMLYQAQSRHGEALPLFQRALVAREKVLGPEHPSTLISLNNLAALYEDLSRYGEAELLYRRALAGRRKALGESHPNTLTTQLNLAILQINQENIEGALTGLKEMDGRLRRFVDMQLDTTLDEKTRRGWLSSQSRFQYTVFSLALQHPGAETRRLAADVLLGWRHVGSEGEALDAQLANTSDDPKVRALAGELAKSRARLSHLMNAPHPDRLAIDEEAGRLGEREVKLAGLSLAYRGHLEARRVDWRAVQNQLPAGSALVALRLFQPVDFNTGKLGEHRWLGMLLPVGGQGEAAPRLADLGPVATVAPLLGTIQGEMRGTALSLDDRTGEPAPKDPAARDNYQSLYVQLFGKWDEELAGYQELYLVADGLLELVPFDALVLPDGRYWVERQPIRRLRAGRDLVVGRVAGDERSEPPGEVGCGEERTASRDADVAGASDVANEERCGSLRSPHPTLYPARLAMLIALGGIDYEEFPAAGGSLHSTPATQELTGGSLQPAGGSLRSTPATRELTGGSLHSSASDLPRLPPATQPVTPPIAGDSLRSSPASHPSATQRVARQPASIPLDNRRLRAERGAFQALPATGPEAEAVVGEYNRITGLPAERWQGAKAGEGRLKRLLAPGATPPRVLHLATHGFFLPKEGKEGAARTERPMTLGGLALAGANRGRVGELGPDGEDGILYALEAQSLNLRGTALVVLSACDTGRGEVDISDGVYGLTRALGIAGARNVLMTLWPLEDRLAAEFMRDFYRNWLGDSDAVNGNKDAVNGNKDSMDKDAVYVNEEAVRGNRDAINRDKDAINRNQDAINRNKDAINRVSTGAVTPAEALRQTRLAWIRSDDIRRRNRKFWAPYVLVE